MATLQLQDDIFRKLRQVANTNYRTPELQIAYMLQNYGLPETLSRETKRVAKFDTSIGVTLMSLAHTSDGQAVTVPEIVRHSKLNLSGVLSATKITKASVSKNLSMLRSGYGLVELGDKKAGLSTYMITPEGRRNAAGLMADAKEAGRLSALSVPMIGAKT
jgi:hypothetical protein